MLFNRLIKIYWTSFFVLVMISIISAQEITIVQNSGDFNSSLWQTTNSATVTSNIMLTPASSAQKGTAYYKQRVYLDNDRSFSAYFQFSLTNSGSYSPRTPGADGFCFVLQTTSNTAGSVGSGMGYAGVTPSVAVEFDTYQNASSTDPDEGNSDGHNADGGWYTLGYNHISILSDGSVSNHLSYEYLDMGDDGTIDSDNPLQSGTWSVWVDYNGESDLLEVRYVKDSTTRPSSANLSYNIDLSNKFSDRDVFVGFSSATGNAWSKHSILEFLFENSYASSGLSTSASYTAATPPAAPDDQDLSVVSGNTVTITAVSSSAGVDDYFWFDSSTSENPIATGSAYTTPELSSSTIYYVTAVNNEAGLQSTSRGVVSITVDSNPPPNPALNPDPETNSTDIDPGTTFSWSAPTAGEAPTGYKIYFGTDDPPTKIVNGSDLGSVTVYDPSGLVSSTTYYWKIVPYNGDGDCTTAPVWNFTTSDASLPVELSLFTAEQQGASVRLEWTTESERDNAGFEIQRSWNDNNWKTIASYKTHSALVGQGTTSSRTEYTFTDISADADVLYYRLRDVHINGSAGKWTETKIVRNNLPQQFVLHDAYPNPFNPQTNIDFELPEKCNVCIKIFNVKGQCVEDLAEQSFDAGVHSVVWTAVDQPSGLYFIHLQAGGFKAVRSVVLLK